MTKEELIEAYDKRVLMKSLKTGKVPRRSGLLLRLLDLHRAVTGRKEWVLSTIIHLNPNKHNGFDRCIEYSPRHWGYNPPAKSVPNVMELSSMQSVLREYLGEIEIQNTPSRVYAKRILYKQSNVTHWALLDKALLDAYPDACYTKDGFVYLSTHKASKAKKVKSA